MKIMIVKETLSIQIYKKLRKDILTLKIPLGSKLINRELQEKFGVSSTPIRDAINKLESDGLLQSLDNSGATVVDSNYESFNEVNEFLKYIMIIAVDIIYNRDQFQRLVGILNKLYRTKESEAIGEAYYSFDYDFHKAFVKDSENRYLLSTFKKLNGLHELLVRYYYKDESLEEHKKSHQSHKKIIKAMEERDREKVIELFKEHYETSIKLIYKKMNKNSQKMVCQNK